MLEAEIQRQKDLRQTENERLRRLHDYAVSQSQLHGKRILDAEDSRDTTFVGVGAIIGAFTSLYAAHVLDLHSFFFRFLFGVPGIIIGAILGWVVFDRLYVKDQSWRRPLLDRSWDEYRAERTRWMRGGKQRS